MMLKYKEKFKSIYYSQSFSKSYILFLEILITILTLIPFFYIGITNNDDLFYYCASIKGHWFDFANRMANEQGRFYWLITEYFYLIPYVFDNFWVTKSIQYVTLIFSYVLFCVILKKIFNSIWLSHFVYVSLLLCTQVTLNYYTAVIGYPFFFTFSLFVFLLGILYFLKYKENGGKTFRYVSIVLISFATLFYEIYLFFIVLFFLTTLLFSYERGLSIFSNIRKQLKDMFPYIIWCVIYGIIYVTYQKNSLCNYTGNIFARDFHLKNALILCYYLTIITFPVRPLFCYLKSQNIEFNCDKNVILEIIRDLCFMDYVKIILIIFTSVYFLRKITPIYSKKNIYIIVYSLVMAFGVHWLLAMSERYNSRGYLWMYGYVTSLYSQFFICLFLVCVVILLKGLTKGRLRNLFYVIFTFCVMICSILICYSNNELKKYWIKEDMSISFIDDLIKVGYFENIENNSIFLCNDFFNNSFEENMSNFVYVKTGKNILFKEKDSKDTTYCPKFLCERIEEKGTGRCIMTLNTIYRNCMVYSNEVLDSDTLNFMYKNNTKNFYLYNVITNKDAATY